MKRYITILSVALFSVSFASCEDWKFLEEQPIREATEGFMDNPDKIEAVLFSSYYQLRRYHCFSRYYHTTMEALADYCNAQGSWAETGKYQGPDPTVISRLNDVWNCMYRSIRFSNTIVKFAPDAENATETEINRLVGEARFLRAFTYLHLAQSWGAVPLLTETNMHNNVDHNLPRTPVEDIYRYVANDLIYAAQNLPDTRPMAGRPQKMTAKSLLVEVYLLLGEWEKAKNTALEVIGSGKYSLVPVSLSEDFTKLFDPDLAESTEEIFYLKYKDGSELGGAFAAMLHRGNQYFNGSAYFGIESRWSNPFMAGWPDGDLRKEFNIYVINVDGEDMIYNKKFRARNAIGDYAGNDYTFYRYADILLYYAEAECRANNAPTADAMEKLNMVHRRAYGKPADTPDATVDLKLADYNTSEKFLELVLQERGYETCYEGKRYNDLKRMGVLAERVLETKGITVGPGGYLFPIPNEEFLYNLGLDIDTDQNPGY